jgi:hypothetical protein
MLANYIAFVDTPQAMNSLDILILVCALLVLVLCIVLIPRCCTYIEPVTEEEPVPKAYTPMVTIAKSQPLILPNEPITIQSQDPSLVFESGCKALTWTSTHNAASDVCASMDLSFEPDTIVNLFQMYIGDHLQVVVTYLADQMQVVVHTNEEQIFDVTTTTVTTTPTTPVKLQLRTHSNTDSFQFELQVADKEYYSRSIKGDYRQFGDIRFETDIEAGVMILRNIDFQVSSTKCI